MNSCIYKITNLDNNNFYIGYIITYNKTLIDNTKE